ncbi:MAG TPA: hypothetical protein VF931_07515 [Steroidobacteraceae bacterium]
MAAAAIAATGTVIGALIQLRVVWRKELSERARSVPVSKKARRGPVVAVGLLLLAAGVGGFALSQYLVGLSNRESLAMRAELAAQVAQISATAARLERATLSDQGSMDRVAADRLGAEGVAVTTTIGPCRANASLAPALDPAPACTEQEAQRVTLCASVPARAVVAATDLYARPEDSQQPWTDSRVALGQDVGRARFPDKPFERPESEQTKLSCTTFSSWNGAQAYTARLVVKYVVAPIENASTNPSLVLTTGLQQ